ncbi:hypothetical protein PVL29_023273 [Vitis rotundifolia]|uniref:Filament-like plant protein n=1 Tax=Vitis rotundifolia TaxID=103349 RepID=A0AA38YNG4_VITRO|nr:hypothetical protein PVL29_023273 [Vitis rotundifolia]
MEKRKWLWKRKSSEKSPGETESSGSISSHSERYSDDQDGLKSSPNHSTQSPEVTSKVATSGDEVNANVKSLTEKLSAALLNVGAKDDLVKQHAKVAEEAVAGWEKAENEVVVLKQQLEAAVQENLVLEDRVSRLDGALKECVRQLRQAREEQEEKISEAVVKKTCEWESTKFELESQLLELQTQVDAAKAEPPVPFDPDLCHLLQVLEKQNSALKHELLSQSEELQALEKENSILKLELLSQSEELEIRTIERDLSTQAAETASKQHLESIKKVAKLEAECRRLKAMARKSSSIHDHRSVAASSLHIESLTDSQSDNGELLNTVDISLHQTSSFDVNDCEPSCSDSWASALIAELDQFKNEKVVSRNLPALSIEIDLMDDFLEMEQLAALPQAEHGSHSLESQAVTNQASNEEDSSLRAELETMTHRMAELEEKLEKMEAEKAELEIALTVSQDCIEASKIQFREAEMKLEEMQKELNFANESKQALESQLIAMEAEARTMSARVDCLEAEIKKEHAMSAEIGVKCQELEDELLKKKQELEFQQAASSNSERKVKQEELAIAAGKLAECQKTIASLGKQLKSLATLEDFLTDAGNLADFSGKSVISTAGGGETWKLHSNDTFLPRRSAGPSINSNNGNSFSSLSLSASSINHLSSDKTLEGFGNQLSPARSRSGIRLQNH